MRKITLTLLVPDDAAKTFLRANGNGNAHEGDTHPSIASAVANEHPMENGWIKYDLSDV